MTTDYLSDGCWLNESRDVALLRPLRAVILYGWRQVETSLHLPSPEQSTPSTERADLQPREELVKNKIQPGSSLTLPHLLFLISSDCQAHRDTITHTHTKKYMSSHQQPTPPQPTGSPNASGPNKAPPPLPHGW
jgi:hypothetical protein